MLDCQLFGLRAGWPHFVNLMFHAANTALVFVLFGRMTGAVWRSAIVAALFAVHPAHVESVAWVAERKDVLSTFFFLLTIWSYAKYASVKFWGSGFKATGSSQPSSAQRPTVGSVGWIRFYILTLVLFACGLMSKPMLVTTPLVLLLLDFWPLQRL